MDHFNVGRSSANDVVLENLTVSRRHAEVTSRPDGLYDIIDLESTGGTFVHNKGEWVQFAQATVRGDEPLRLGNQKITVNDLIAAGHRMIQVTTPLLRAHPELVG
ncbi:MAG: FHA domain-containing protein [Alphaproteobacteria bacterium]